MSDLAQHDLDQLSINALRFLACDAVEKAKSGHPGAPLGCAPIAYLLYTKLMKYNPLEPKWTDRDRFVLSNGHASALLYGALHLAGYDLPLSQVESFRQWGSHTPGHPELGETPGVEVTTGPLGQGLGMAVGLAIAEKHQAAIYNHENHTPVDHYTYVLCGDGDLMEGISHESCSLAGTLGLGKLIVLYDDNLISLDGPTDLSYTEDVTKRFEAYHWHVQMVHDGNDLEAIEKAILAAKAETAKPSLIRVRTVIGYGSPKAGTKGVHGEPLGAENLKATKKNLGWPEDKMFYIPEEAAAHWGTCKTKGAAAQAEWQAKFDAYKTAYPELGAEYERTNSGAMTEGWEKLIPVFPTDKAVATRNAGQVVMNAIAKVVPELFGGAADLTSSTKTIFKDSPSFHVDPKGRNVFFGVREFGMMAAVNGIAAHGGLIPFGSTFYTFSDYCRSAIRMGALETAHSLYIFTHDSIGLGEDGPTHQPIEHLMSMRVQAGVRKGAYVLEAFGNDVIIVATGSEVAMAMTAALELKEAGILATVVSMPSFKIFEEQSEDYKMSIFPHGVPKVSIEAGATMGWYKYIGRDGIAIGLDRFGASAPAPLVQDKLGISAGHVVKAAKSLVKK